MTGLPKESATDSVKIAVTCIKKMFPELLKDKHIHVHFGEGSVPKDGPSAGVALFMSIFSAAIEKSLKFKDDYDVAYTGEISLTGHPAASRRTAPPCSLPAYQRYSARLLRCN